MKIHNFSSGTEGDLARASATVTWEDCDRPQREIYIETNARFASDLNGNPNAFLLGAIMPAMRHGEHRVLVEGAVCPQLRNGLVTAMQILRGWYGEAKHRPVMIEATQGFEPPLPRSPQRAASFLSGGVDGLTTLRSNRLDFPLDHPASIQDCFLVHGIDIGGYEALDRKKENFELAVASLSELARSAKVTLIPVYMNLRYLDDSDQLFSMESHGAVLAAIAHAFSRRVTIALIASTSNILELTPWGSHPLLDPNYSSAEVCIQHDGARLTRLEKVGLIADWDAVLQTLRSCYNPFRPDDVLNCAKCEKCIRTMTELLVFGKLKQCRSFPLEDISPDFLRTLKAVPQGGPPVQPELLLRFSPLRLHFADLEHNNWRGLIDPLRKIGRRDLAEVIEVKLSEYEKYQAWMKWKGVARRLDHKYLGGVFSKLNLLIKGKCGNGVIINRSSIASIAKRDRQWKY